MASIDDRIVQMQFDNSAFERKMSTTIQSLQKLDQTIANAGSKNGLDQISRSARGINLAPLATSVQGVSAKFLAMSTIAVTALAHITTRALSAGTQLVKSLALQPVIDGFKEYELQIGSIQTILANTASKGTNLTQVNAALDELNQYSDKTIYNFGEMTKNIGTFTAAGVDLDTSVRSIKGIANLAAISGSSSAQASTAMYQLSQAIATGSVKLMDWNSVVNAGMGGEVFQKALFDTGVAMQSINDVPLGTTFEQWKKDGNSFRGSLQEGWLTSEVLTNTLSAFTGEMTEAQLTAIGFTKEQAAEMIKLGNIGVDAATKVRTFTQLIQTTKEALGSGWSQSFRIIFGDFEEATRLWTGVSGAIGEVINRNAEARNKMLTTWDKLGGRGNLIDAVWMGFKAVGQVLGTVKEAFRDVFPPMTGRRLAEITANFKKFVIAVSPTKSQLQTLKTIFTGFFSALSIGWTVLKEGVKFIADFVKELFNLGSGNFTKSLTKVAEFITGLRKMLVLKGGISEFFDNLREKVKAPIAFIQAIVKSIKDFIKSFGEGSLDAAGEGVDRFADRFSGLKNVFGRLGDIFAPLKKAFSGVGKVLNKIWVPIRDWFKDLGNKLADVMEPGDYDKALDTFNTAFLGGIVLLLRKFLKNGLNINFNSGVFDKITGAFDQLTGVLKAMQTDLKSNALLKIAAALGVLTLSLMLLATINSADLTRALIAMSVGFGQLIGAFALINKIGFGPRDTAKFIALSAAMTLLATAMLILAVAVKLLSSMSWEELAKGLAGVTGMLLAVSLSTAILSKTSGGMIRTGIGLIALAVAVNILALAAKQFADMSWTDMAKGAAGIAGGLLIIAGAMHLMPATMPIIAAGLLMVAVALPILAGAVMLFASMSWTEIARGMVGLAGGLLIIAGAMNLMPPTMPLIGAGLILVSIALAAIGKAMQTFAGFSWSEIGRGLASMAGALLILAAASYAMSGSIAGAIAIGIIAISLGALATVVKTFAAIKMGDLFKGLLGMAAVFAVIGISAMLLTPAIGPMLALGAALILLGAGIALFGIGAQALAKAFELLAKAGTAGIETLIALIDALIEKIPAIAKAAARGVMEFVKEFLEGTPAIVKALGVLLEHLLDTIIKLLPKAAKLIGELISHILKLIREKAPEYVQTGLDVLLAFLRGIGDNIGEVVKAVAKIITEFLDALADEIPRIVSSLKNLVTTVIAEVILQLNPISLLLDTGKKIIAGMDKGFKDRIVAVASWLGKLPMKIIRWIGNVAKTLWDKGVDLVTGLLNGLIKKIPTVTKWFTNLPKNILRWIGGVARTLLQKGIDFIQGLWDGISRRIVAVTNWFIDLPNKVFRWIGGVLRTLVSKGKDFLEGLWTGISNRVIAISLWFITLGPRVAGWVGKVLTALWQKGVDLLVGLWNGIVARVAAIITWFTGLGQAIVDWIGDLSEVLVEVGKSVMNGLWQGMQDIWDDITGWLGNLNPANWFNDINLKKGHAEKNLIPTGKMVMDGLGNGMSEGWVGVTKWLRRLNPARELNRIIHMFVNRLERMEDFHPRITPVLDLTLVEREASRISRILASSTRMSSDLSYSQAQIIAAAARPVEEPTPQPSGSGDVNFEQNIYAPKQLSVGDIYRQTRNQITMAKEELAIP